MTLLIADAWILDKVANEKRRNIDNRQIYSIIKETEKAYYVMLSADTKPLCAWLPKSTVKASDNEASLSKHTFITNDYEKAKHDFYDQWSNFK